MYRERVVGVNPTPLEDKIGELRVLLEEFQEQGASDCYNRSKGPCRGAMVLFDQEFMCESQNAFRALIHATINYLEGSKEILSPL